MITMSTRGFFHWNSASSEPSAELFDYGTCYGCGWRISNLIKESESYLIDSGSAVPTKNSVHIDFLDYPSIGSLALLA